MRLPPKLLIALLVLVLIAASCGSSDQTETGGSDDDGDSATRPSIAGLWQLDAITIDGTTVSIPDTPRPLDLEIELGQVSGTGGCNRFGGQIVSGDDGSLSLVDIAITEMACVDQDMMSFETTYVSALIEATTWSVEPNALTFSSDSAELRFVAGAAPVDRALVGTVWRFDTVFSGSGADGAASSTDQSGPEITMLVSADQATFSSAGCSDDVTVDLAHEGDEQGLTIDGNVNAADYLVNPADGCEDPTNIIDAVDGLLQASGFMIAENRLTLIGGEGDLVGFIAAE
ncbi:MAG: META domain-containing protein [Acidimicrobiales bacterium]